VGDVGKTMMLFGIVMLAVGAFLWLGGRLPWLGRLPGDFVIEREDFRFYFPLGTSIVVSFVLSLLFILFRR